MQPFCFLKNGHILRDFGLFSLVFSIKMLYFAPLLKKTACFYEVHFHTLAALYDLSLIHLKLSHGH